MTKFQQQLIKYEFFQMVSYHLDDPDRVDAIRIAMSLKSTSRTRRKKFDLICHVYIFLIRSSYVDFNMPFHATFTYQIT